MKTPSGLPKHIHFRLASYDPILAKRPSSFPDFNYEATYISGFDPSDKFLYQVTLLLTTKPKTRLDDTCWWSKELSDEPLHEIATQLSKKDKDQEDLMNTSELLAMFYITFENKWAVKKFKLLLK